MSNCASLTAHSCPAAQGLGTTARSNTTDAFRLQAGTTSMVLLHKLFLRCYPPTPTCTRLTYMRLFFHAFFDTENTELLLVAAFA